MKRNNFLYGFIGTNRTGKSSIAKQLAISWKNSNPNGIVISHDPQDNFTDITDIFIEPEDNDWAIKCCEYRNCLIILDDFRLINESARPVKGLSKLLYYRAKWNIDIITVFHNPSLVINSLAHFISHYFIFMTNAQEGSFKNKIPNYSLCVAASEEVNKYVSVNGRGKYPIFPFVIVDCEKQKLMAINLEKNPTNSKVYTDAVKQETNLVEEKNKNNSFKPLNQLPKKTGIGFSINKNK